MFFSGRETSKLCNTGWSQSGAYAHELSLLEIKSNWLCLMTAVHYLPFHQPETRLQKCFVMEYIQ